MPSSAEAGGSTGESAGPHGQVAFEVLEGGFHFDHLQIELPHLGWVGFGEVSPSPKPLEPHSG